MAQVINTNTMSLNAQRNLSTSGTNLATTIQRLSSGLRINSAKDDAAGLAISERFSTQIRGANQAARNANDGISLAQTAEGALGEIGNNLQRMRELAVQSRSATNSPSDRQALNSEVQLLKQEIQRVAEQTNFNGTSLLDGSFTNQAFQIGANQGQTINISQIANANISKLGNWTSASTAASMTGAAPESVAAAGTPTVKTMVATAPDEIGVGQPNAGEFAFGASVLNVKIGDDDVGININVAAVDPTGDAADAQAALLSNIAAAVNRSDAMKTAGITMGADGKISNAGGEAISISSDLAQVADVDVDAGVPAVEAFAGITEGQFQINGVDITVGEASNAGDRATALVNAVNAKTHETGVTASLIEGKVQLTSAKDDFKVGGSLDEADLLKATGLAKASTEGTATAFTPGEENKTGFADLDISSVGGADNAILAMDAALNSVNSSRADLGAIQNRFTSVVANLNTSSENMSAARSRIRDVDYASETAELTRNQILQQAGTAMLAQANQSSQSVLSLLG